MSTLWFVSPVQTHQFADLKHAFLIAATRLKTADTSPQRLPIERAAV